MEGEEREYYEFEMEEKIRKKLGEFIGNLENNEIWRDLTLFCAYLLEKTGSLNGVVYLLETELSIRVEQNSDTLEQFIAFMVTVFINILTVALHSSTSTI